jgi:filamentous hemagglutinin family protein
MVSNHRSYDLLLFLRFFLLGGLLLHSLLIISHAQITLDGSLGRRGALKGPNYTIGAELGQISGPNLFHSFGQFNIRPSESATFTGPDTIDNVVSRVTGGNPSNINGLLRSAIPEANLFLLNPSGVLFGPNAELDVGGSFHTSTADFLRFADGKQFYANLSNKSTLTVASPAAFGFLGNSPASLTIQESTLQVPPGETVSVIGGDIDIMGKPFPPDRLRPPTLRAPGGQIHIASVASAGEVVLNSAEQAPHLSVDTFARLGSITLSQDALIDTSSDTGGGTVVIRGGHLLIDNSRIAASTRGDIDSARRGVDLQVTADAVIKNGGAIQATTMGRGNAGMVSISAPQFVMEDNARIAGSTAGDGHGGDIVLTVGRLTVTKKSEIASDSGIRLPAGNIAVGKGSAGRVTIAASELVSLSDGALRSTTHGQGAAGIISISTPQLIMEEGSSIGVSTTGDGQGGNIMLEVGTFTGKGAIVTSNSGISSSTGDEEIGEGSAGDITVSATESVFLADGSKLLSNTLGQGAAGTISITTPQLTMHDDVRIEATTSGSGQGGDITVEAGSLTLTDGSRIGSNSVGTGFGGTVHVTALDTVTISGSGSDGLPSGLVSDTLDGGDAGQVTLVAPTVRLEDGGGIRANSQGEGHAGDIRLEVGSLTLAGGAQISTGTKGAGQGGTVTIKATDNVTITGSKGSMPSGLLSDTAGEGDAGGVTLSAPIVHLEKGALITAETTETGHGGNIVVDVDTLSISGGAQIGSSSRGAGQGGTVTVTATETVSLSNRQSGLLTNAAGSGTGGDLVLQARDIELTDGAVISAASSGTGNAGRVTIQATDMFRSVNSTVTTEAKQADGGDIELNTDARIRLINSEITATVGGGPETVGGNITIIDPEFVILENSQIIANAFEGQGGNIRINAGVLLADPESHVSASSARGINGEVNIRGLVADLSGSVTQLPQTFLNAVTLLRQRCAERLSGGKASSFVLRGRDGLPLEPDGMLPSPLPVRLSDGIVNFFAPYPAHASYGILTPVRQTRESTVWADVEGARHACGAQ